jgi:peptidoglycan/xylan/chitin deacetylase (PgdA/CDA1 family)
LNRSRDLAFLPGTEYFWARRLCGKVTILVYHRVAELPEKDVFDLGGVPRITPEGLRDELGFLSKLGAQFLTLRDLREGFFPAKSDIGVVVTFDDGFRDSYEQGLPIVESLGGRAVVFQCTAMLGAKCPLPEHRLYQLLYSGSAIQQQKNAKVLRGRLGVEARVSSSDTVLKNTALTGVPFAELKRALDELDQADMSDPNGLYPDEAVLRSASAAGHEIGSHGHLHLHRATLCADEFDEEMRVSRQTLAVALGEAPAAFSYPFGAIGAGDAVRCSLYFSQAATCERTAVQRGSDPLALGRFSWPGNAPNRLRFRRWLLSGSI